MFFLAPLSAHTYAPCVEPKVGKRSTYGAYGEDMTKKDLAFHEEISLGSPKTQWKKWRVLKF